MCINKDIISKSGIAKKGKFDFPNHSLIETVLKCQRKFKNTYRNGKLLINVVGNAL